MAPERATRPEPSEPPALDQHAPEKSAQDRVTLPKVLDAHVSYPKALRGDHDVILELVVRANGSIESVTAVKGAAPFAAAAERAALTWRFEPARRGGQPIKAKIRFQVRFSDPRSATTAAEVADDTVDTRDEPSAQTDARGGAAGPRADPAHLESVGQGSDEPIEVLVAGERRGGEQTLSQADIKELPGAFGDPFRAIETLPGVVPIASGVPYFYVRGAPPGNVGYFFDGVPVPALYHFAAGPGVIHPALVERVDLYSGAYPARYGRVVGGVVTGELAAPSYTTRAEASVRLIDSGGFVEAPFAEGRGSAMLAGRYSYTGAVLSLLAPEFDLSYWDYQGRVRYHLDEDDSIELFGFGSADFFSEEIEHNGTTHTETALDIDFHRLDLRWDRRLRKGHWRQALTLGLDNTWFDNGSLHFINRLVGARSELSHQTGDVTTLRAGADVLYERLDQRLKKPLSEIGNEDVQVDASGMVIEPEFDEREGNDGLSFDSDRSDLVVGLHADVAIQASPGVEVTPGVRGDLFFSGKRRALAIDPRILARFTLSDDWALTHGLGVAHQSPSFTIPLPGVKPSLEGGLQRSLQHSAGAEYGMPYGVSASLVLFQNVFFNMTDALGFEHLNEATEPDERRFRMTGRAYGAELMLRRSLAHDLGGFVAYTLARSERSAGRLEGPAATDRTHVLNMAGSYHLGNNWRLGARVLLYSGAPARVADLDSAREPPRAPGYWRLDWRVQKRWPISETGYVGLIAEVLNTTLNKEVTQRDCTQDPCQDEEFGPLTIPSIGVEAAY